MYEFDGCKHVLSPQNARRTDGRIHFERSVNRDEIVSFFQRMGRTSVNDSMTEEFLGRKCDCWLMYDEGMVIGGSWVIRGEFPITRLTEHWLAREKVVIFDKDTLYRCFTILDHDHRGQGIGQAFTRHLLRFYAQNGSEDYMVLITSASNGANIGASMRNNAKLIGIVEVKCVAGNIVRRELFMDRSLRKWSSV